MKDAKRLACLPQAPNRAGTGQASAMRHSDTRETAMRYRKPFLAGIILFLSWASLGFAEDYTLQYFLNKTSIKEYEPSKKEKTELLNRMNEMLEKTQEVHKNLVQAILGGEITMDYQEGKFWMAKLMEDRGSIEAGMHQLTLLKEKPDHLAGSIKLYKSLRDLSVNFNAYNNMPLLSAYVGDLAPEIELWADPVFYKLYVLSLAASRDKELNKEFPKVEKKPTPKK
jgi:hypothetical protein